MRKSQAWLVIILALVLMTTSMMTVVGWIFKVQENNKRYTQTTVLMAEEVEVIQYNSDGTLLVWTDIDGEPEYIFVNAHLLQEGL